MRHHRRVLRLDGKHQNKAVREDQAEYQHIGGQKSAMPMQSQITRATGQTGHRVRTSGRRHRIVGSGKSGEHAAQPSHDMESEAAQRRRMEVELDALIQTNEQLKLRAQAAHHEQLLIQSRLLACQDACNVVMADNECMARAAQGMQALLAAHGAVHAVGDGNADDSDAHSTISSEDHAKIHDESYSGNAEHA